MATFTVTNTNDSGAGSLRQAILDANVSPVADRILFDELLNEETITLTSGVLEISDDLIIDGSGVDKLTISGGDNSSVFNVNDRTDELIGVEIVGLNITGGAVPGTGGGIINWENLTVINSTVADNSAIAGDPGDTGGGIANLFGNLTLINSTVSNNQSFNGAGLSNFLGNLTIINSTISDNVAIRQDVADFGGGGLLNRGGTVQIINSTFFGNWASDGGGILNEVSGIVKIENSIVAKNIGVTPDVSGDFASNGYNLIGDGTGSTGLQALGDQVGTSNKPIEPKLGPLQDNGGLTQTHALLAGSPGIDAGNPNSEISTEFDQRGAGFARVLDGDGDGSATVDIGAFEFPNFIEGTSGDDLLIGTPETDLLDGGRGDDSLEGKAGNDTLIGGKGNDFLRAMEGNDSLDGGRGKDTLRGGTGEDVLNGGRNRDDLRGGRGDDVLNGGWGRDFLDGSQDNDILAGEAGRDTLIGGEGNDWLKGGAGSDKLIGIDGITTNANPVFFAGTGHYYEFVKVPGGTTWGEAKAAAENRVFHGIQGHLVTITSQAENDFVNSLPGPLPGPGLGAWIGASDAEEEGVWKWVTGPEAGTQFWQNGPSPAGSPVASRFANWASGEPNNISNEDFAHIATGFPGPENFKKWNDLDSDDREAGYFVEYSSSPGAGEMDTLTGGASKDTFILGDKNAVYYDDGNPSTTGESDFALITDFDPNQDFIQLNGSAENYSLDFFTSNSGSTNAALIFDPGASARGELIATLEDVSPKLNLSNRAFIFV